MHLKKNITIFLLSNIITSTTLFSQDTEIESIGFNAGYSKMFYTSEKIDIDKPKTNFYNLELYTILNNFFTNNSFKPTLNYIYSKNKHIDSNSLFIGLNRYDNFEKFKFYTGLLIGYSELNWKFDNNEKKYTHNGVTGGFQIGMEFPFTDSLEFNIDTKYLLYQRKVDLRPQYDVQFTHTGTLSLSFGLKYLFGKTKQEKGAVNIYHIETDDGLLDIEIPDVDLNDIVTINRELDDSVDSDKDGIADMLDNCSDSVVGELVDELGCAKDDDDDFVIDRLDKCLGSVENEIVDENGCAKDSDGDKVVDRLDNCGNSVAGEIVDEKGCAKDSDDDAVIDRLDKCPNTKAYAIVDDNGCPEEVKELEKKQIVTLSEDINSSQKLSKITLKFAYKSEKLRQNSQLSLNKIIKNLKKFPKNRLILKSFTDSIGSKKYNLKLSARRSNTVLKLLMKEGIDNSRVMIHNMGESSPIASNMLKAGREKNRRIEVEIVTVK